MSKYLYKSEYKTYTAHINRTMTIDLLSIKPQMAAILDIFFNETLKVTHSFRTEFSIKNHIKMKYYIKVYVK